MTPGLNLAYDVIYATSYGTGTVVILAENAHAARADATTFLKSHGMTPAILEIRKREA